MVVLSARWRSHQVHVAMTMVEGVIFARHCVMVLIWPAILRNLCFTFGRKRHFNGSYGLQMTEKFPSLMCMGCTTTYVPYVENVTYVTYILDMVAIVNYNFVLPEDLWDLHYGHGSDAWTTILYWRKNYVTYILDMVATLGLQFCIDGRHMWPTYRTW